MAQALRFGRCFMPRGTDKVRRDHQKYVWSDEPKFTDKRLLAEILDVWNLEPPNLVISLVNSSYPHPARLVEAGCLKRTSLQEVVKDARAALATMSSLSAVNGEDTDKLLEILGEQMVEKLIRIFEGLISACTRTNSWHVVDNSPSAGQFILEQALCRSTLQPVVLCICNHQSHRFRSGALEKTAKGGVKPATPESDEAWDALNKGASELKPGQSIDDLKVVTLSEKIAGGSWPQKGEFSTDWTAKPIKAEHNDPFNQAESSGWGQWPLRSCSHYIFTASVEPFPLSWLGPAGKIMTSCGGYGAQLAFEQIQAGRPLVIMNHSGKASDFWSLVWIAIVQEKQTTVEGVMNYMNTVYPFWSASSNTGKDTSLGANVGANDIYNVPGLQAKIHSFIRGALDVYRESPMQFTNMVVVLDVWNCTTDHALSKLTAAFAQVDLCVTEVGTGSAEKDCICSALEQQAILEVNSVKFARIANTANFFGAALSFLSTFLAVVSTYLESHKEESWASSFLESQYWPALDWATTLFPAVAGFAVTLMSRMRYVEKWAQLHMASARLESEIYSFRVKGGEYDAAKRMAQEELKKQKSGKRGAKPSSSSGADAPAQSRQSRAIFAQRVSQIFMPAVSGVLSNDALDQISTTNVIEKRRAQKKALLEEKQQNFEVSNGAGSDGKKYRPLLWNSAVEVNSPDDLVSPLSIEEYFEHRLMTKLHEFQVLAPWLAKKLQMYEILIFVASLAGTLLATLKCKEFVPVSVALGSVFTSYLLFESIQSRLSAVNHAIGDLLTIATQWHSIGVVEKRMSSMKNLVVQIAENSILSESTAFTGGASAGSKAAMMKEDQGSNGDDKKEKENKGEP